MPYCCCGILSSSPLAFVHYTHYTSTVSMQYAMLLACTLRYIFSIWTVLLLFPQQISNKTWIHKMTTTTTTPMNGKQKNPREFQLQHLKYYDCVFIRKIIINEPHVCVFVCSQTHPNWQTGCHAIHCKTYCAICASVLRIHSPSELFNFKSWNQLARLFPFNYYAVLHSYPIPMVCHTKACFYSAASLLAYYCLGFRTYFAPFMHTNSNMRSIWILFIEWKSKIWEKKKMNPNQKIAVEWGLPMAAIY